MTSPPIGTDEELIVRLRKYGHIEAADALLSRIAEVERFCAIMDKTDDEGFSPEIEQELMDLRATLSQHGKV